MKLFSLEEAQALLPIAQLLIQRGTAAAEQALLQEEKFAALRLRIFHTGGLRLEPVALARGRAELEKNKAEAAESFRELDALGVQSRSPQSGQIHFPCRLAADTVVLCWERGDPAVGHWHEAAEACGMRRPIDVRFVKSPAHKRSRS